MYAGVTCCEDDVMVLKIWWSSKYLKGTMDFSWIPPTVTQVNGRGNMLTGSRGTAVLPRNLKNLYLHRNNFFSHTLQLNTNAPFTRDLIEFVNYGIMLDGMKYLIYCHIIS